MKRIKYILTVLLIILVGCHANHFLPNNLKDSITICYSDQDLYSDSIISFHGYYSFINKYDSNYFYSDNLIFFKNGWVSRGLIGIRLIDFESSDRDYIDSMFYNIINNKDSTTKDYLAWAFNNTTEWGTFNIVNDTVNVQTIFKPDPFVNMNYQWYHYKDSYKIIDNHTIQKIHPFEEDQNIFGEFIYIDSIPKAKPWLFYEKWMWCDENEFHLKVKPLTKREKRKEHKHYYKVYKKIK